MKTNQNLLRKLMPPLLTVLVVGSLILAACTGEEKATPISMPTTPTTTSTPILTPTATSTPMSTPALTPTTVPTPIPPTPTPTNTPIPTHPEEITAMTYNILAGGGVGPTDPNGSWCCDVVGGCCGNKGGNRLPLLLEIIKAANPDILGIQEANLWQQDNDAIARQVAHELGMNYYIGASGNPDGSHVVLFTKFRIIEAQNYPDHFTSPVPRGGLHAVLTTDGGNTLHIFVVHLRPDSITEDEILFVSQIAQPYLNDLTIIMGDMNFGVTSTQADCLRKTGWELPIFREVDQIWVSPKLSPYTYPSNWLTSYVEGEIDPEPLQSKYSIASDHFPVVTTIDIYSP